MSVMRILAFDTSGPHCAVALACPGAARRLVWRHDEMGRGQAERLMPMIDEVLDEAGIGFDGLSAVAVGVGPGNFTGIRIAVSAARGLALGLGIPAIGVDLFEAQSLRAFDHLPGADEVLVCLPAPRDSAYVQLRTRGGEALPPRLVQAGPEELSARERAAVAIGPASGQFGDLMAVDGRWTSGRRSLVRTLAIAHARLTSGTPIPKPAPLYVRSADAAPASDPPPVILQ